MATHRARLLIILAACCSGCGTNDPNQLRPLSGTVLFQGRPLAHGSIGFFTTDEAARRVSGALINQGRYDIPADFGLMAGTYRVQISSPESPENPSKVDMIGGLPINRERIPPDFNAQSKHTVKVLANGDNIFNFSIP